MPTVTDRPYFGPDQIRSSREIKLGDKVVPVHFSNIEYPAVEVIGYFTTRAGFSSGNKKMNRGFLVRNYYGTIDKMFYADKGLIPYGKRWNESNWLKKSQSTL